MENLIKIQEKAQTLANKRTWIKTEFNELMDELDKIVAPIHSDYFLQVPIDVVRSNNYEQEPDRFYFRLDTTYKNACFELRLSDSEYYDNVGEFRTEYVSVDDLSIYEIRELLTALPDTLNKLLAKIEEKNIEMDKSIKTLENIKNCLNKNI